jgi:uncharacterized protein (TIGR04141 family)
MITPPYLLRSLMFWLLLLPGKGILVHTSLEGGGANATLTGSACNRMLSLNGFLLRSDATPANAWTDSASEDVEIFSWEKGQLAALSPDDNEILQAAEVGDIIVTIIRRFSAAPPWQNFIRNAFDLAEFGSGHESLGAAVFCAVPAPVDDGAVRWVAWTFGSAGRALRRSAQDPRFGLLAVLNLLVVPLLKSGEADPVQTQRRRGPQLREMRYRTTAPYVQQTGHRAARDIPVDGFRVDQTSDLVAAVGGTGADPALTTSTLLGGRSLRFRAWVNKPEELTELASIALERSGANEYKEMFSWIDNIRPVDEPGLTRDLRAQLTCEILANPDSAMIDAILPDDLIETGEDRSIRYILFPRERGIGQGNVTLTMTAIARLLDQTRDGDAGDVGLDADLRFLDESGELIGTATVLECISATLKRGDAEFVAYDGDFYAVNHSFVSRIDAELSKISLSGLRYPRYGGETEPVYNMAVARDHPDDFVLLDRALIELPDEHGVEAADLVCSSGALIHVKRKGKSSVLSHLFLQVANSCELLRRSTPAWQQLSQLIRERAASDPVIASIEAAHAAARNRESELEVAFAFLGDWSGKTITSLPLFSRISMVNEARRVSNLGFRPTVALISMR